MNTNINPDDHARRFEDRTYFTIALTSRILGTTPYKVMQLVDAGKLTGTRLDGSPATWIPANSLGRYTAARRRGWRGVLRRLACA